MQISSAIRACILSILCYVSCIHAALQIEDFQKGISTNEPIYQVRPGELENVLTNIKKYNMIVLVTTSEPKYQCAMCEQFDPILKKVATNIYNAYPELLRNTFFIRVEASGNLEQLKKLGTKSVPQIWGFPDSRIAIGEEKFVKVERELKKRADAVSQGIDYTNPDWFDIDQAGMEHYILEMTKGDSWDIVVQKLSEFISNTIKFDVSGGVLGTATKKQTQFDWVVSLQWFIYVFIGIKVFQKIKSSNDNETALWMDKRLYAYISIVLILINISGFNFTIQRHAPFISQKEGQILWVAPSSNTQFGSEIAISILLQVFFIGALFSLVFCDSFDFDQTAKNVIISLSCLTLIGLLMLGSSIYHLKYPGYPFSYLW